MKSKGVRSTAEMHPRKTLSTGGGWKAGDAGWRGYARHYGDPSRWFPEVRPTTVDEVNKDGTLRCRMQGIIPGSEGKRNPGQWVAFSLDADLLHRTPEKALSYAKRVAIDANAEAAAKATALSEGLPAQQPEIPPSAIGKKPTD